MVVMYRGVPEEVRRINTRLRPAFSEADLDTAARMYHQQNGEGWEQAMIKDMRLRLVEQGGRVEFKKNPDGSMADGYVETTEKGVF